MVPQRRVFRVCASKLASDESLGHQHMGVVYHRGRSHIASNSESHGGDLIIQRYNRSGWRVGLLQCSHSFKGARQVRGQGRMRIYRSRRKGRRCKTTDSRAMGLAGPWIGNAMVPHRRDFREVIDPLLSWRESIGRKRSRGGGEYRGKLQVPRQGGRAEAEELHKTGVDGLLIKIAESEGLQVDTGVLDQGTNQVTLPSQLLREWVKLSTPVLLSSKRALHKFNGSARVNKDQHNSANPILESVIGELKQHGGSEFNYSTTATESDWEPKGRLTTKAED
ncbi:hypothetical protein B296_00002553 [Ensete ventricosum]|uniref:Uncharacterized protein n=1 Tax=Ensete ventricosum TaxID=4639 RepID=A0A426ZQ48_ENSVE|nr:hypothetical protein B296_00002553 [Ensete ventricosum]